MNIKDTTGSVYSDKHKSIWFALHIDLPLLLAVGALIIGGLFILYSAGNESISLLGKQTIRLFIAFVIMIVFAQIPPRKYFYWAPWLFAIGIIMLISVLIIGHIGKGAQRWFNLGLFKFQPSEFMKIAIPMTLAWMFSLRPLPPRLLFILLSSILILIPAYLTAKQPDLGTAIILAAAGSSVVFFSGIRYRYLLGIILACCLAAPILWHFMHVYQQQRVLTFFNPELDPLGAGYHIIQSKIAIGSGGLIGKGWLHGTQSHLEFLPEHATDFIYGVVGEEFGLIGGIVLIGIYLLIVARGLYIGMNAQDTFTRLLGGSLAVTFFMSFFVNIGMVTGILPVVGLPLPLVSYGGTSMVVNMATFGIIMAIHTHRKLLSS